MSESYQQRLRWVQIGFISVAVILILRVVQLQVFPDQRLARLSMRQFQSQISALPVRGAIYDRNGEALALSRKVFSIYIRPLILKDELKPKELNRVIGDLAKALSMPKVNIQQKISNGRSFVWLKRQMSDAEERKIRELGLLRFNDGIGLVQEALRMYPNESLAAHVLGSVNIDGQGIEGIEYTFDRTLRGRETRIQSMKDARGRRIFATDQGLSALIDGESLVLTLDKTLQHESERQLKAVVENTRAKAASAIVMNVHTGEILALANYPNFNPNDAKNFSIEARRNRVVADTYEPGSTFKPFIVAASLENGFSPSSKIYCEMGQFKVQDRVISEAETHEKFEWLTLTEIIKFSSNIGAAKLALKLGPTKTSKIFEQFGFGRKTGVELPGEALGIVSQRDLKSQVRLANVGFGHGFTATPLQIVTAYAAIANGGQVVHPTLVKALLKQDAESLAYGEVRYNIDTSTIKNTNQSSVVSSSLLNRKTAQQLQKVLAAVVTEGGTGEQAQLEEWPVAGKTGTAQKIDETTKKYSRQNYIASFAGFAPVNKPHLAAIVVVDEPRTSYYASQTAAPVFREIMRLALLREKIPPQDHAVRLLEIANQQSLNTLKVSGVEKKSTDSNKQIIDLNAMPDLGKMTLRQARRLLGPYKIKLKVEGAGDIVSEQLPKAGDPINPNDAVVLHMTDI
jgi:cell division protein FtsI (penicillin-binding protein 3)